MQTRKTFQKSMTLDAVKALKNHPTADEIYTHILEQYPDISRATVYRNLNFLCQSGNVYRVKIAGGADHFDFKTQPHYHFRCEDCGKVCDVELDYMSNINLACEMKNGYKIKDHQIFFEGLCEICAKHS